MKEQKKEKLILEKGITLIALVITIVILIILATVTLNVVLGKGGLIYRAQQAKDLTEKATEEEQESLNSLIDQFDEIMKEEEKYSLTIKYEYAEGEEGAEELPNTYTLSDLEDGFKYRVTSPAVSGYVAVPSEVSSTINGKDENITVIYYEDANGNDIPDNKESYTVSVEVAFAPNEEGDIELLPGPILNSNLPVGHSFYIAMPEIDGYVARPTVVQGIIGDSNVNKTVYYYKDANGNGIPDSEESQG